MQQLGPYMGLGFTLAATVAVGTVGGYYADRWLGTSPWLTLLGILFGIGAGLTAVLRVLLAEDKKK